MSGGVVRCGGVKFLAEAYFVARHVVYALANNIVAIIPNWLNAVALFEVALSGQPAMVFVLRQIWRSSANA